MDRKMVLMVGIPGSGKSTFYKKILEPDYVRVNLDTLKTRARESALISRCFSEGKSFAIDDTNVTKELREGFISQAKTHGYQVIGYFMRSSVKECVARNHKRTGAARVPDQVVANMSNRLELPSWDEGFDELYYVEITEKGYNISAWRK